MAFPIEKFLPLQRNYRSTMTRQTFQTQEDSRVFRLNERTREILSGDHSVKLTKKECDILQTLISDPGRVFERDELLKKVWGAEVHVVGRTIDAHIVKLRRKMQRLGEHVPTIETVWALGYRFKG